MNAETERDARPALSWVIPLYNSASSLERVVAAIEALEVAGGQEIVLVNDGSRDGTEAVCRRLLAMAKVPVTYVAHARNFGEHNAVLSGYRVARGRHLVNIDDDGQNPPAEGLRLYQKALESGADVVYGVYETKQHVAWRNRASRAANRLMDFLLDKPAGLYLSSFRCVTAFAAAEVARFTGPFPYIDGLLLQATQRIESLTVRHEARQEGESGYTLRKLFRLWMTTVVNFSVMPLRVAMILGTLMAGAGAAGLVVVILLWMSGQGPAFGWGSLMAALLIFSGTQLVMLGIFGEYLGRLFLAVNQKPQSVWREVVRSGRTEGRGEE